MRRVHTSLVWRPTKALAGKVILLSHLRVIPLQVEEELEALRMAVELDSICLIKDVNWRFPRSTRARVFNSNEKN